MLDILPGSTLLALSEVAQLRSILRKGWLERGVSKEDCENDLEHTARVTFNVLILPTRKAINRQVALTEAVLHDLHEAITDDEARRKTLTLSLEGPRLQSVISQFPEIDLGERIRWATELIAFDIMIANWPLEVKDLAKKRYSDFLFRTSDEARFVHQAQTIAELQQGLDYLAGRTRSGRRYRKIDLSTFWEDARALATNGPADLEQVLKQIEEEERRQRAV